MAFPTAPTNGQIVEIDGSIYKYHSTDKVWEQLSTGNPIGTVLQSLLTENEFDFETGTLHNWVLCDGRNVAGSKYATATGRNTIPDMRGAYMRMAGTNTDATWIGGPLNGYQEMGTALPNNAFRASNAGTHHHAITGHYNDQVSGTLLNGFSNNSHNNDVNTKDAGDHSHNITGGDIETRPKTYSVNYFIRIN